jgi:tRNA threonylcarbamoyladenosine biosynthesis protein TsaB
MKHPLILHIETSTETCSVALSRGTECIAVRENHEGRNHATLLTPFIEEVLKEKNMTVKDLNAVSISSGPGSYTGLRIGLSTAKGLCYGADIPLIAVPTLHAMTSGFIRQQRIAKPALFCPMIDARRMEVYTAIFDNTGNQIEAVSAEIITENSFLQKLEENTVYFFGNGASKCSKTVKHPNAIFMDDFKLSAGYMIQDAVNACNEKKFENVAYFEPFYLKDFIAGKPKGSMS